MTDATIYDIPVPAPDGSARTLAEYRGRVLLIVNVASRCGFTPQYAGLEALYQTYKDRGLVVLGFPCNQFLWQEPGTAADIEQVCRVGYGVTFPVFAKVRVNGADAHPLYRFLTRARRGLLGTAAVKWNFTKFLVGRDGAVVGRFAPLTPPDRLAAAVEAALDRPAP
jgi:glutathione peroxidase